MYVGRDFDISDVGEDEIYSFDYVNDLRESQSVVSGSWTMTVKEGTDPSPSSHLTGLPTVDGTIASQRVSGLLDGVIYRIQCKATLNDGSVLSLYSYIRCMEPD